MGKAHRVHVEDIQVGDMLTTREDYNSRDNENLLVLEIHPTVLTRGTFRMNPKPGSRVVFFLTSTQKKFDTTYQHGLLMDMWMHD